MALRGSLRDFSLPDVFQLVQLSGKTGVLRIQGADAEGSIWFRDGDVFFAQSNWRREQLGERLVSAQRITPAALSRALEIRQAEGNDGLRLGQILVGEGYITQQVLETFVQEQIQDTIFDLMRWDQGEFDFEVLPEVVNEDIGLSVSVENIVMEGSRRLEEWQRIKKKVPSTDMVFKMATAPGEGTFEISLKPVEWALLLLIDGTRSVRELAKETHSTDFEVARVVYGLFSAGLLEVADDNEVEHLRADRARREDKRATLEAERAAIEAGQAEEALELEAKLAAYAESRRAALVEAPPFKESSVPEAASAAEETLAEEPAPVAAKPERIVEEPEFLAVGAEAPSTDDMVVFEQMMASVLSPQVDTAPIAEPQAEPELEREPGPEPEAEPEHEPEPEAEPAEHEPGPEPEPEAEPEPTVDFFGTLESDASVSAEFIPGLGLVPEIAATEEPVESPEPTLAEIEAAPVTEAAADVSILTSEAQALEIQTEDAFAFGAISEADLEAIPAPPVAESKPLLESFTPSGDFEADLRSLGLGEMPAELLQPELPTETRLPMSELESIPPEAEPSGLVPEVDVLAEALAESAPDTAFLAESESEVPVVDVPEQEFEVLPAAVPEPEPESAIDIEATDQGLDSLLASLESASTDGGVISSGTDYGPEAASGGVISTDEFLAEFDDVGLSAGLGDELTALTGGATGRSRPVATVTKLPEAGETRMLHRDQMVDRALLEKIIEGVENL